MEKKNNAQLKALLQLKQMVQDMIDEDFKSHKMPKLMAVKVTKVEGPKEMTSMDSEPAMNDVEPASDELCEECGMEDCSCEMPAPVESDAVMKLKKLLRK